MLAVSCTFPVLSAIVGEVWNHLNLGVCINNSVVALASLSHLRGHFLIKSYLLHCWFHLHGSNKIRVNESPNVLPANKSVFRIWIARFIGALSSSLITSFMSLVSKRTYIRLQLWAGAQQWESCCSDTAEIRNFVAQRKNRWKTPEPLQHVFKNTWIIWSPPTSEKAIPIGRLKVILNLWNCLLLTERWRLCVFIYVGLGVCASLWCLRYVSRSLRTIDGLGFVEIQPLISALVFRVDQKMPALRFKHSAD